MAKVKGPFFSLAASGSFGKTITYQGRKGTTAVFLKKTPYDSKQAIQLFKRDYMTLAVDYWHKMPAPYVSLWNSFVK